MTYASLFKTLKALAVKAIRKLFLTGKTTNHANEAGNHFDVTINISGQALSNTLLSTLKNGSAMTLETIALPKTVLDGNPIHEDDPDSGDDPGGPSGGGGIHEDDPDPGDDPGGSAAPIHEDDPDSGDDPGGTSSGGRMPAEGTQGAGPQREQTRFIAKLRLPRKMSLQISKA